MPTKKSDKPAEYDDLLKRLYVSMITARYAVVSDTAIAASEMESLYDDAFGDAQDATEMFFANRAYHASPGEE